MNDAMGFPATVEEFMEQYKIVDREEVYTNGAEMVPIFRMKQWFEHEALGKDTNVPTKWIPVSERLPKEEGDYIVTDEAAGMAERLIDKYIQRDDGTWVWMYSQHVIAWMPLPEPWKGEKHE